MNELHRRIGEQPAPIAGMMAALAGVDRQIDRIGAAAAEIDGRPFLGEPRTVGGDQHVGAERLAVFGAQFAQARGAGLLAHLDQPLGVEAELAALGENGIESCEIDAVLAFVVGGAAAPVAPGGLVELPRVAPLLPASFEAADDVAMAVAEHGRVQRVLDALGEQERPFRLGMGEDAAGKAERIERRLHLLVDIAGEVRAALRILALRRDRHAAREIGLEGAAVEVSLGAGDGALPAHCAVAKIVHIAIVDGVARSRSFCSAAAQMASADIRRAVPRPRPGIALMCLKRRNLPDDSV